MFYARNTFLITHSFSRYMEIMNGETVDHSEVDWS